MAFGTALYSADKVPLPIVYVPGSGFFVMQGSQTGSADSNGNTTSAPIMVLSGPLSTDAFQATVFAAGELRVAEEPAQLLSDGFDAGLDTTNKWKSPTAAGGGVAASNVQAMTQLGTGTPANGYSYLESQMTFPPRNPGWLLVTMGNNIPFPYVANTYFFWGLGTSPATPTAAAPLTDAAGFEVAIGGKMYAVCYAGGTRSFAFDLSASGTGIGQNKQPQDASVHLYYVFYKGDNIFWAIDSKDNIVAQTTSGAPGPNTNILPLKLTAIAGSSAPASSGVLQCNTVYVSDTARNHLQIADGTYPWRKAAIDSSGNIGMRAAQSNVPVAAGVGTAASVVKSSPGYLKGVLVTATGTANLQFFDNASAASGTVIGVVPSSATLGQFFPCDMPALLGITAAKLSGTPAVTVSYS